MEIFASRFLKLFNLPSSFSVTYYLMLLKNERVLINYEMNGNWLIKIQDVEYNSNNSLCAFFQGSSDGSVIS